MSRRVIPLGMSCAVIFVLLGFASFSSTAVGQQALIIDHTCTNIDAIPEYWIDQAKQLTIHYAHTSHGSQVNSGAENWESMYPFYSFTRRASGSEGLPAVEDPPALRMYDGNPPETYITPEDYWSTEGGRDRTRAVAGTGNYDYSMWSWCGQQSSNSYATTRTYLEVMRDFEDEYPGMRFILMTGHTDGSGEGGNLNLRNQQVRDFANSNGMVLFDFADIESYDPAGEYFLNQGCTDSGAYSGGNWPAEWCAVHPGNDLCDSCSCAHSTSLICNLKGRAFWWMMARLAGWNGYVPGDANYDGYVDHEDYDLFADCMAGPGVPPSPTMTTENTCLGAFDLDPDDDVDLNDFVEFEKVYKGRPGDF